MLAINKCNQLFSYQSLTKQAPLSLNSCNLFQSTP